MRWSNQPWLLPLSFISIVQNNRGGGTALDPHLLATHFRRAPWLPRGENDQKTIFSTYELLWFGWSSWKGESNMRLPTALPSAASYAFPICPDHPSTTSLCPHQPVQGWGPLGTDGNRAWLPKKPTPQPPEQRAAQHTNKQEHWNSRHQWLTTVITPASWYNGFTFVTAFFKPIWANVRRLKPTTLSNHHNSPSTSSNN